MATRTIDLPGPVFVSTQPNHSPTTFVYAPGYGYVGIRGFQFETDRIDLSAFGENSPRWDQIRAAAREVEPHTWEGIQTLGGILLDLSAFGEGSILIENSPDRMYTLADLSPDMFIGLFTPPPRPVIHAPVEGGSIVEGSNDSEQLVGSSGNDMLLGLNGADDLFGNDGDDSLWGGGGSDSVLGGNGDDLIFGQSGRDTLDGGAGQDTILGGLRSDRISGGQGDDRLWGEDGRDLIYGNDGADTIGGGEGNDTLRGGGDSDYVWGEAGDDTLDGGSARDILVGGPGSDRLIGGVEGDTFFGGNGPAEGDGDSDTFVIIGGLNWVMDFDDSDRLSIGMNLEQFQAAATQMNEHLHVALPNGGDLYIANTMLTEIEADNLIV